jgi:hypothetical protein
MTTNYIADRNTTRSDEARSYLSAMFPSVDTSEIQKAVEALVCAEVGFRNDNVGVLAWNNQSAANPSFRTANQNPLQADQELGYPDEINGHPSQAIIHDDPSHLDNTILSTGHQEEFFSDMLAASPAQEDPPSWFKL